MNPVEISAIVFVCVFGAAISGLFLRAALPGHHLCAESKETVTRTIGLVATTAALVLGLLISSAKTYFDTQSAEVTQMSSRIIFLDRLLAKYGPETRAVRNELRDTVAASLDRNWSHRGTHTASIASPSTAVDTLPVRIEELAPQTNEQRFLRDQALEIAIGLGQTRWLMYEQSDASIPKPLLIVLIFWLTTIFFGYGLFAVRNATVVFALFVSALSLSGAFLLISEMYAPFTGLIQVSSAPLRAALEQLQR